MEEDKKLDQTESAETLESSQDETKTPVEDKASSPEEEAWSSLKGNTQDRIRQILRERDEYKAQLSHKEERDDSRYDIKPEATEEDDVQLAVKKLRERGVVTEDVLKSEVSKALEQIESRIQTDRMHNSLEKEFNGANGLPKYVREEVEDYARRNNIWNLKAAYRDMYFDEILDAGRATAKKKSVSEKPTSTKRSDELTLDTFRDKLRGPDADKYYAELAKNPQALDQLLKELTSEE